MRWLEEEEKECLCQVLDVMEKMHNVFAGRTITWYGLYRYVDKWGVGKWVAGYRLMIRRPVPRELDQGKTRIRTPSLLHIIRCPNLSWDMYLFDA